MVENNILNLKSLVLNTSAKSQILIKPFFHMLANTSIIELWLKTITFKLYFKWAVQCQFQNVVCQALLNIFFLFSFFFYRHRTRRGHSTFRHHIHQNHPIYRIQRLYKWHIQKPWTVTTTTTTIITTITTITILNRSQPKQVNLLYFM